MPQPSTTQGVNKGKGLGKGFDSLLPSDFDESLLSDPNERIQKVAIKNIQANPEQPRKHFDEQALQELAASIRQYGILQPLVVTKQGEQYTIIAGERRFRAAQIANLKTVPVIARSHKQLEQLEIALIENVQRVDLSPLEQAASIMRLHEQFSMTFDSIAKRLGKATTTVNNIVRLLQLPDEAKQALNDKKISEGHARSLLALKQSPELQKELLENIQKYGWSVRQAEQFVTGAKQSKTITKKGETAKQKMATTTPATKLLEKALDTPITIRHTAKGGRLELHFNSDDDLDRIIEKLQRGL